MIYVLTYKSPVYTCLYFAPQNHNLSQHEYNGIVGLLRNLSCPWSSCTLPYILDAFIALSSHRLWILNFFQLSSEYYPAKGFKIQVLPIMLQSNMGSEKSTKVYFFQGGWVGRDIISKTANRRAKWTKVWDSVYYSVGYFWCPSPWVWFGVIQCTLRNFQFYKFLKTLLLSQFSSDSSKLYTRYHNHTGCHFFGDVPKIPKIMAFWHFSQPRTICSYNFQSAISDNFSHNFH